jgi:cobalt-zinc-cadmium efflux system membrane fusion protein
MSSASRHDPIASVPATSSLDQSGLRRRSVVWLWLSRAVPTGVVLASLAGVALWGHFAEWKVPRFSALTGAAASTPQAWCDEHNVAEAECIECQSSLLPPGKDYGWCKVHGIHQCPLDHPDVAQLKSVPAITPAMLQRANLALALKPRAENNSLCNLYQKRIQFASIEAVDKAGVDIAVALERPIVEAAIANGEVVYDQTRTAHLSSRVSGTVWQVERQLGDRVTKGDLLALVDAAEVGKAKADFLQGIAQAQLKESAYEQLKPLAKGVVPMRQIREVEAAMHEAQIRLQSAQQALVNLGLPVRADDFTGLEPRDIARRIQFLGLPENFASTFDAATTTSNLFPIRAPFSGTVTECHIVAGEVVDSSVVLFTIVDTSRLWLSLNVQEEDATYVALGQTVLFRGSNQDESEIRGTVSWISTAADDQTRTVKVRVELPNPDGRLRANTFGTGRIVLREEPKAVVVPTEAVHTDGNCRIVFVRDKNYLQPGSPKFFHVRSVRPGVQEDDMTEIIVGLLPGEVIASKNSVVLEAQLLKSNLGAGCGCADGH